MCRRVLNVIVLCVMVGSLISLGCSAIAQRNIKLSFIAPSGPRYSFAATGMAQEYMKRNPNVYIEVEAFPYGEYIWKVALDVAGGGGGYDIIWLDYKFTGGYAEAGYLLPLDEYLLTNPEYWKDIQSDVYPNILNMYKYKGHWYGIPHDANTEVFYYRKDLLTKAGITVPENWDEVLEAIPKLDNPPNVYAIGGNLMRAFGETTWSPMFWSLGGWYWDENFVPQVNSQAGIRAAELYKKIYQHAPKESLSWREAEFYDAMGNAGIIAMGPLIWCGASLTDPKFAKFADQIDVTRPPLLDGNLVMPMGGFGLAISARSPHPEEVWKFIAFYTSRENQRMVISYTGQPSRISALMDPVNVEKARYFPALLRCLKYAKPRPVIPEFAKVEQILGIELNKILTGESTPREAMDSANSQIYEVMLRSGRIKK